MTILKQEMYVDRDDPKKTVRLRTTYDVGTAMNLAQDLSLSGGGRVGSGSGEMRVMGYIPPEMWGYDPWLRMAKQAERAGDMGEHMKYIKKFFEVHPSFAVITPKKYF